jgi:hypothetical protein
MAAPRPALAADPSRSELAAARDLFSRAERDEDAGRWADALDKLRRAGTVKMTPGIRFHVALCEEKLGQLVAALADYAAAEATARAEGNKDVLDAIADPIAALRARVPTLTITPPAGAKDAVVSLDGTPLAPGLLGTPIPVEAGVHTVQAQATGHPPFAMTVSVFEKQAAAVEVRMPVGAAAAGGPVSGSPAPRPAEAEPLGGAVAPSSAPRTAAIVASVGAASLVGFGLASYFIAGGQQSAAETACLTMVSCDGLRAGPRTWDALALGAWIAGGGVAAFSVYLWTRPATLRDGSAPSSLVIGPGAFRLEGQF